MSNETSLECFEEPKLQVYVEGDFDTFADKEIPEGSVCRAAAHRAMLLESLETPVTLAVLPEDGAIRLMVSPRRTFRSFRKRIMEALIYDMERAEDFEGKSLIISSTVEEEKRVNFLRGIFQRYLLAEEAVARLVPKSELETLDVESGILFPAALDSYRIVRGNERPKLKCYEYKAFDPKPLLIEATPYYPHKFTIRSGSLEKYEGAGGDVVIPAGVTEIGYKAFDWRSDITSVQIPEGVTKIGNCAFEFCKGLTELILPQSIRHISSDAFGWCENLKHVRLPDRLESMGNSAFHDCISLKEIQIPDGITSIERDTFSKCSSLESVRLPDSVKNIESYAFSNCTALKSVRIPKGVISLENNAFEGCSSLESVEMPESIRTIYGNAFFGTALYQNQDNWPDGVLYIGSALIKAKESLSGKYSVKSGTTAIACGAFSGCDKMMELIIPEGITVIGGNAFQNCRSLTSVSIPEDVTEIGGGAFSGCGALKELSLPQSLKHIGMYAFQNCRSLTSVSIPEGVTEIGGEAFSGCGALKELSLPQSLKHIGSYAFSTDLSDSAWSLYELQLPQGCKLDEGCFDYSVKKVLRLNADFFAVPEKLPPCYAEFFTMAEPEAHAVAMCRLYQTGKTWQKPLEDAVAAVDQDALIRELCAVVAETKDENAAGVLVSFTLDYLDRLSFGQMQEIYAVLKQNGFRALKKLALDKDFQVKWLESITGKQAEEAPLSPIEQLVKDNWKVTAQTKKLKDIVKEGIKLRDSDKISSPEAVIFVISEYASQLELPTYLSLYDSLYVECKFSENADKVAAALDPEALQALLEKLAYTEEYNKDGFILALGRYGSGAQISHMIAQMKDWETWYKYAATGRRNIIIARGALMLSETREAMLALDKSGHLGAYAAMRGEDADTLRDTVLSEFGFDAEGKKSYSLGANTLQVSLDRDLKLVMFDYGAGKTVKSVPKKNADPALYEAVKVDIAELKKNIRRVVKSRGQKLFSAFLSGRAQEAESWKASYLGNPVLKAVAELIVWEQDGKTFTVSPDGPADSFGQPYTLSNAPIRVAYPSEMDREALARWQALFLAEKRKQPFEQIWEPVIDPATVKPDRYKGCELNIYKFSGKEQHGIGTYGMGDYSEVYGFSLTDCKLEATGSVWRFVHGVTDDAYYTLGDFTLESYSRVSNHIMGLLDRWTVSERVLKDEIDLGPVLASFTLAQIMELIELASKNEKPNSLAVLMEYKNKQFPEADPLAEFTLE